jgi:hypothetical protein
MQDLTAVKMNKEIYLYDQHSLVKILPECESFDANIHGWKAKKQKQTVGDDGWIVYGSTYGNAFSAFNGTWNVPQSPSAEDNQLIYFFTGLEDSEGKLFLYYS